MGSARGKTREEDLKEPKKKEREAEEEKTWRALRYL